MNFETFSRINQQICGRHGVSAEAACKDIHGCSLRRLFGDGDWTEEQVRESADEMCEEYLEGISMEYLSDDPAGLRMAEIFESVA